MSLPQHNVLIQVHISDHYSEQHGPWRDLQELQAMYHHPAQTECFYNDTSRPSVNDNSFPNLDFTAQPFHLPSLLFFFSSFQTSDNEHGS